MSQEIPTTELMNELANANLKCGFENYQTKHAHDKNYSNFSDLLHDYLFTHPELLIKDIISSCGLEGNYARQIINGTKNGSKYKVLSICLAAKMTLKEIQRSLKLSGNSPLYPKEERDAAIIICINNNCYNIMKINEFLNEKGLDPLE